MPRSFVFSLSFAALVFSTLATAEKKGAVASSARVLGLIDIRGFGQPTPKIAGKAVPPTDRQSLKLYRGPSTTTKVVEVIDSVDSLEMEYRDKLFRSAKVYDSKNGWFLVGLKNGQAWASPDSVGSFYPLEKLVAGGLSYLTPHWDGRLWKTGPQQGTALKIVRSDSTKNVRVVETRQAGDEPWMLVEILTSHGCNAETPVKKHEGWVPLYAKSGQPNFWFQARGCGAG